MVGTPKKNKKPAGKSIHTAKTTIIQQDTDIIERKLDNILHEVLTKLARLSEEVQAARVVEPGVDSNRPSEQVDTPVFIPKTIGTGVDMAAEINIESSKTDGKDLDNAIEALRKIKALKGEADE